MSRYQFAKQRELFSVVNTVLHPGICYMTHVSEERYNFLRNFGIDEMVVSSSIKNHEIGEQSDLKFIDPKFQEETRRLWARIVAEEEQSRAEQDGRK